MTGFGPFLGKELREIAGTWRIWVLPGLLIFFGLTSPVVALLAPALLSSLAASQPGAVIRLPDPVAADAYRQFLKNLDQIVLIALIIAGAGAVSGERRSGTAALVLTRPLSRSAFVLAKMASQGILVVASCAAGAVVCVAVTSVIFGTSPIGAFLCAVLIWLVRALFYVVVMTLLSVLMTSTGGAIGAGLGVYLLTLALSPWPAAADHSVVGLSRAAWEILAGGSAELVWPVTTTVLVASALGAWAIAAFRRQEI